MCYTDEKLEILTVECISEDLDPTKIVIKSVLTLKSKDYETVDVDGAEKKEFVLSIHYTPMKEPGEEFDPEPELCLLQFTNRDLRDSWEHGIKNIMTGKTSSKSEVSVPSKPLVPITGISLKNGTGEELMTVVIDLDQKQVVFPVQAPAAGVDQEKFKKELWEKVIGFVEQNSILQTETMSLFRYIRTVVQRAVMEKEVATVISDISSQSLQKLIENRGKPEPGVLGDDELHAAAEKRLDVLLAELPERLGQTSGAPVITQVLRRNIEKMKLMNSMVLKLAAAAPAE